MHRSSSAAHLALMLQCCVVYCCYHFRQNVTVHYTDQTASQPIIVLQFQLRSQGL
jgi:hypothetical protein